MNKKVLKLLTIIFIITSSISCKKAIEKNITNSDEPKHSKNKVAMMRLASNTIQNPYSLKTIRLVLEKYADDPEKDNVEINSTDYYVYLSIDPQNITSELANRIENDNSFQLYDFPIDSKILYEENSTIDERESIKDGNLYAVIPINNTILNTLRYDIIDTLYQPKPEQVWLEEKVLWETGFLQKELISEGITPTLDMNAKYIMSFLTPKKPEGYVRYQDTELGLQPVRGVQVWGIKFGFAVWDYTDATGHFKINNGFLIGTVIGTLFKGNRFTVKPLVMNQGVVACVAQFLAGSIDPVGWYNKNQLPNISINYTLPSKQTYMWSHIANSIYFHDLYCQQENVWTSPSNMVIYAYFDNGSGGSMSTPMFNHMTSPTSLMEQVANQIFGVNVSVNFPSINALLTGGGGILPDMYTRGGASAGGANYSTGFMQNLLHELSHAHFFVKVGSVAYQNIVSRESVTFIANNGYGNGNLLSIGAHGLPGADGGVQVAESWAEFLGQDYANRIYTSGSVASDELGFQLLSTLDDDEHWFSETWIHKGIYNDLMDGNSEPWDQVQGLSIKNLYDGFTATGALRNDYYLWQLRQNHPWITATQTDLIFNNN